MNGTPIPEERAREIGVLRNVQYRAFPTRRDYSFTFEFVDNHWRAYINNSPDYQGRPSSTHQSHRLGIGSRPYVCWEPAPTTLSMAQSVAAIWADATENYIATGTFRPPANRPQVQDLSVLNGYHPTHHPAPRPRPVAAQAISAPEPRQTQSRLVRWWHEYFG